jgi:hypothetical protein
MLSTALQKMCSSTFCARNALVRFDERDVETGYGLDNEAPADEWAGNRKAGPNRPRHISTLPKGYKPVRATGPSSVRWESSNLNWSHHELCSIEQSAFSRPRKPDLSLLKKRRRARP